MCATAIVPIFCSRDDMAKVTLQIIDSTCYCGVMSEVLKNTFSISVLVLTFF